MAVSTQLPWQIFLKKAAKGNVYNSWVWAQMWALGPFEPWMALGAVGPGPSGNHFDLLGPIISLVYLLTETHAQIQHRSDHVCI